MFGCKNWGDDGYWFMRRLAFWDAKMGRLQCLGVRTREKTDMGSGEDWSFWISELKGWQINAFYKNILHPIASKTTVKVISCLLNDPPHFRNFLNSAQ